MARKIENDLLKAIGRADVEKVKHLLESEQCPSRANWEIECKPMLHYLTNYSDRSSRSRRESAYLDESVRMELLELFLQNGAEVDVRDSWNNTASMAAAKSGLHNFLKVLIENGGNSNLINDAGQTCLMIATANLHLDCVSYLVEKTSNLDQADKKCGRTALMLAFGTQNLTELREPSKTVDVLKLLIQNGASINIQDREGVSALMMAAKCGSKECLELLLSSGAQVDQTDSHGKTALLMTRDFECVKMLIDHGAQVNKRGRDGKCPLVLAFRNKVLVELLLAAGADADATGWDGETVLMRYVDQKDDIEMVQKLLQHGASVNVQCSKGRTPLITAARTNHTLCLKVLLNAGAVIEAKDKRGYTALVEAAAFNHFESVSMLISAGADVNVTAQNGVTALIKSIKGPRNAVTLPVIQKLIDNGASVNAALKSGKTPLMCAAENIFGFGCLNLLLAAGADINAADIHGDTALTYEIKGGHGIDCYHLLSRGAAVNVMTAKGRTPLMFALNYAGESPNRTLVEQLLEFGANVNAVGNDGQTPLSLALSLKGRREVNYPMYNFLYDSNTERISGVILALLKHGAYLDLTHKIKHFFKHYRSTSLLESCELMQGMVRNGCPPTLLIDQSTDLHLAAPSSLLEVALLIDEPIIMRYLLINRFLTHQDITQIFSREATEGGCSSIRSILRQRNRDYRVVEGGCDDVLELFPHLSQTPFSLFTLSFVEVSTALDMDRQSIQAAIRNKITANQGGSLKSNFQKLKSRSEKVEELPIPTILKEQLLFQTQSAAQIPENWDQISLDDL